MWALGLENDVFTQIGLVMLIGLSAKNAILIVEFAKVEYEKGKTIAESALTAARLRLRPILMTSFAFILGVVPLVLASGAGAHGRILLGIAVLGGMLAASFIAIFLIPVAYTVVENLVHRHDLPRPGAPRPGAQRRQAMARRISRLSTGSGPGSCADPRSPLICVAGC